MCVCVCAYVFTPAFLCKFRMQVASPENRRIYDEYIFFAASAAAFDAAAAAMSNFSEG